jgi:hypothetical protein
MAEAVSFSLSLAVSIINQRDFAAASKKTRILTKRKTFADRRGQTPDIYEMRLLTNNLWISAIISSRFASHSKVCMYRRYSENSHLYRHP